VRTIFVEVPAELAADAVQKVTCLNERLAGLTLKEIRADARRPAAGRDPNGAGVAELLNIFVQERKAVRRPDRDLAAPRCISAARSSSRDSRILDAPAAAGPARVRSGATCWRRPDGAPEDSRSRSVRSTPTRGCRPSLW